MVGCDDRRAGAGHRRDERGSVLPLVALWLLALAMMAMVLVAGLGVVTDRARAQAAADAGALAGAADGRSSAEAVVTRNGAVLVDYRESSGRGAGSLLTVDVTARYGHATASAAAERYVPPGGPAAPPAEGAIDDG